MNLFMKKKVVIFSLFLVLIINISHQNLYGDSFRVKKVVFLDMEKNINDDSNSSKDLSTNQVKVGINDSICIKLPKDMAYIEGIELSIKIPPLLAKCPNTVIYTIYNNISPVPSEKNIDFTGQELFTGVYPGQLSLSILIPLVRGNSITKTPYAVKTFIPEYSRNFIFIRNQLAMKGIPSDILNQKFTVSAKPIFMNRGKLVINANLDQSENIEVTIDDKIVTLDKFRSCYVKPGHHTVTISADSFRTETRTCYIEATKETVLDVNFKSTEPLIYVNMPKGTKITKDSREIIIENNSFSLNPGEHTLVFTFGNYELVKNITIIEGRTYSINITFDATFTEN